MGVPLPRIEQEVPLVSRKKRLELSHTVCFFNLCFILHYDCIDIMTLYSMFYIIHNRLVY